MSDYHLQQLAAASASIPEGTNEQSDIVDAAIEEGLGIVTASVVADEDPKVNPMAPPAQHNNTENTNQADPNLLDPNQADPNQVDPTQMPGSPGPPMQMEGQIFREETTLDQGPPHPQEQELQGQDPQRQLPVGHVPEQQTLQGQPLQLDAGQLPNVQVQQGQPPHVQMQQGQPPQSQLHQSQTRQGQLYQGQITQPQTHQQQEPHGQIHQDQAPQDQMRHGMAPQGQVQQGMIKQEHLHQGQLSQGQMHQGQVSQGLLQMHQGQSPQGQMHTGQVSQGQMHQGQGHLDPGHIYPDQLHPTQMSQMKLAPSQLHVVPFPTGPFVPSMVDTPNPHAPAIPPPHAEHAPQRPPTASMSREDLERAYGDVCVELTTARQREKALMSEIKKLKAELSRRGNKTSMSNGTMPTAQDIMNTEGITIDVDIGPSTSRTRSYDQRWKSRYQDLVKYKLTHGDCIVPKSYQDKGLHSWVRKQRILKKDFDLGLASDESMTQERVNALNNIGFAWVVGHQSNEGQWERNFQALVVFKSQYGHTRVPQSYDKTLHKWVLNQRCRRRLLEEKGPGKAKGMTWSRIEKLDAVDFAWSGKK